MIVVRRKMRKRFPQNQSPAMKTSPMPANPMLTLVGVNPCIISWSRNPTGGSRTSWKTDCVVHEPSTAFRAIQVGARSHTPDEARMRR